VIDLAALVAEGGGLLEPLRDCAYFAQVKIEPDFKTLVWPNDLDLDPDVLYEWTIKEQTVVPA
jgi:hypothetical protein